MPASTMSTPSRRTPTASRGPKSRGPKTRSPKSHRADGTPKKRWTAAERVERDRGPRRRGGQSRPDPKPVAHALTGSGSARVPTRSATSSATDTRTTFADLGLAPALVAALHEQGISEPFPIQAQTIPDALAGRDILGRGRTGTGKTLAFGLPLLTRLAGCSARRSRGLVLVPTRELALQVADVLTPLARTVGLRVVPVAGGMAYAPQTSALARGVDIVVATPGRLIDLMESGAADLGGIEVTVLDEADQMADLGFLPAMTTILNAIPTGGQRLLFSATLDDAVAGLSEAYLANPVRHEAEPANTSMAAMAHHVFAVRPADKAGVTAEIAGRPGKTVLFVRTQRGADRVAEQLREAGVMAGALHGGLAQGVRTRTLAAFREGRLPVLVATDVAARGIHVDDVSLVLQVDPPAGPKEYLHRAGRTARAGANGVVATLGLPHQQRELRRLVRAGHVRAEFHDVRPGDRALAAVGATAPSDVPIPVDTYARLIAPPAPAPRRVGRTARAPRTGRRPRSGRTVRRAP